MGGDANEIKMEDVADAPAQEASATPASGEPAAAAGGADDAAAAEWASMLDENKDQAAGATERVLNQDEINSLLGLTRMEMAARSGPASRRLSTRPSCPMSACRFSKSSLTGSFAC